MPAFQKLMVGALEKMAKRQAELAELQKAAAKRIELEKAANSMFTNPDVAPQGPLTLAHGSPFKFDEFDFEGNMRNGEGAMAFGPGGYMTGNDPLARQYAQSLYDKHAGVGGHGRFSNPSSFHRGIREAATIDPKATAEFLRARTVSRLPQVHNGRIGTEHTILDSLPPHASKGVPPPPNVRGYSGEVDGWLARLRTSASDFDEYRNVMTDAGLGPAAVVPKVGVGGLPPAEVVRMGKELRKAARSASPLDSLRPRIQQELFLDDLEDGAKVMDRKGFWNSNYRKEDRVPNVPGLGKQRQNLNSTYRVATGRPGNSGYVASMSPGGRIDLRDPQFLELAKRNPELARRIYRAQMDASFGDMLPYDYPLATMRPEKIGALAQLAEQHSFLDALTPELTGQDFLRLLSQKVGYGKGAKGELDQVKALKAAGIPATFFLRAGRRNGLPDKLNPDDFNFVIHDQTKLGKPDVEEFATGGRV